MEILMKIFLLLVYGFMRAMPFVVTGYCLSNEVKHVENNADIKKEKINGTKKFLITVVQLIIATGINVTIGIGIHFYHYRDLNIGGNIINIWKLNFYHQDVEYFAISSFVCVLCAIIISMVFHVLHAGETSFGAVSKKQVICVLGSLTCSILVVMISLCARSFFVSNIKINEICSNNTSIVINETGQISDYIELYNDSKFPCQIEGLYLSDEEYNLQKMPLDGLVLQPGGYVIVPCIDEVGSFAINKKGETIYLSDKEGNILEEITLNEMAEDMTYSRSEGTFEWRIENASPGVANDSRTKVLAPVLSNESGFYDAEFQLEISAEPGTVIYYTLDGSIPDETSYVYETPIHVYDKSEEENVWSSLKNVIPKWYSHEPDTTPVRKAFIIRAIAVDEYNNKSDAVTATYFVNREELITGNVISLVADPNDLFGDEGICVTGKAYDDWYLGGEQGNEPEPMFFLEGRESERDATMEFFVGSERQLCQDIGIRVSGSSTRKSEKKRFSIYAREEYSGSDRFDISFFGDGIESHSAVLRQGFADVICQELVDDRNICTQRGIPITVFLNGEFWYDTYLREKYSPTFFEDYYAVDEEDLIVFKGGLLDEGVETDERLYNQLLEFLKNNDLSNEENYVKFGELVDIQNYIDFVAINVYLNNMDIDDTKNIVMWRSREGNGNGYNDGRWRWALYDMDCISWQQSFLDEYGTDDIAKIDSFSQQPQTADVPVNQLTVYKSLRNNETFCKQFVLTFMDLINTNFSVEIVSEKLETWGEDITWMHSYFVKRPEYMISYLAKEFELEGTVETVTLYNEDETEGTVQLNTITPEMVDDSWSGQYYTDYPILVTAVPKAGYEFVGWSGSIVSTEKTIEVPVTTGGIELKAEFQKVN